MNNKKKSPAQRVITIGVIYTIVTMALFFLARYLNGQTANPTLTTIRSVLATILDVAWCIPITIGRMAHGMPGWLFGILVLVNAAIVAFVITIFVDIAAERRKPQQS